MLTEVEKNRITYLISSWNFTEKKNDLALGAPTLALQLSSYNVSSTIRFYHYLWTTIITNYSRYFDNERWKKNGLRCSTRVRQIHIISNIRLGHLSSFCLIFSNVQINHQPDAAIFQFIMTFIHSSTCFGRFPTHHQELNDCSGSLWFYLRIVVIAVMCSWSGRVDHEHSTTVTTIRR